MSATTKPTRSSAVAPGNCPELFCHSQECIKNLAPRSQSPDSPLLQKDLSVAELNGVHQYLSIVGSFRNISALHHQEVLQRKVIPSQAARLHLVWFERIIFIKPLPDYLLNAAFFKDIICHNEELYGLATGFLYSYCRLIESPLDLALAHKLKLLNDNITWEMWYSFSTAILQNIRFEDFNKRWEYGELRLGRLNLIWRATGRGFTYFTIHTEYATYFNQYFKFFITVFALLAIILQAMQIIIAVKHESGSWDNICYGFSLATLFAVVASLAYVLLAFFLLVLYNALLTMIAHHKPSPCTNEKGGLKDLKHFRLRPQASSHV